MDRFLILDEADPVPCAVDGQHVYWLHGFDEDGEILLSWTDADGKTHIARLDEVQ